MSERARVRDTYYQRADSVSKQLYNELSRLIHEAKLRLNYSKLYYPSLIVNFVRANALIQRGNAVIDEVTTSNVFLGDVQKVEGHLNPGLFNPKLQLRTFQPQTFQP